MTIVVAREMLAFPPDENCCECIFAHHDDFVWDDYGDEVDVWNRIAGARGLPAVLSEQDGEDVYLIRGEQRLLVPLRNERGDNTIGVHTLGLILLPAVELRVCVDTAGNSEYAFMPLTAAEWQTLESEFGKDGVDYRFVRMGNTVDELWDRSGAEMETRAWY